MDKYTKYKICLSIMMQHLSNIWSLIHEKFKQQWGWNELKKKNVAYKKACNLLNK